MVEQLEQIKVAGGLLGRTRIDVNGQDVIVFHKNHPILKPRFLTTGAWESFLAGSHGAPVLEVDDAHWPWNHVSTCSFNCHALAIGSHVGLGPNDWLEGSSSSFTLGGNPARILLDEFFTLTLSWDGQGQFDENALGDQETIILEDERNGDIIHSGTVRRVEGQSLIVSKFGEHPVIMCSLQVLLNEYAGQFTRLQVYRLRDD